MATWHALSTTEHLHAGWTRFKSYAHAKHDALAPIVAAEIPNILSHYAIAFSHSSNNTDEFQLTAILSLQAGLNLYLDANDQWQAPYVPAHYRSYPFSLMPNQKGEMTLCFDQESQLIHTPAQAQQIPLLNADKTPSAELQPIIEFLQQRQHQTLLTQTLTDQLAQHQLIQPWSINSAGKDGEPKPVKGLYRIDEAALKALDPQALSDLAQSGALGLAYAQLLSQTQLKTLTQRFEHHSQQHTKPDALELDLDQLFGEDDDSFKF